MCVMSPSAGTGASGLHVELCVPNENHRAYSVPAPLSSSKGKVRVLVHSINSYFCPKQL
jgi:hypothetical protein